MTVKNDKDLISVDWQHNGEPIELTDNYYSFPGEANLSNYLPTDELCVRRAEVRVH